MTISTFKYDLICFISIKEAKLLLDIISCVFICLAIVKFTSRFVPLQNIRLSAFAPPLKDGDSSLISSFILRRPRGDGRPNVAVYSRLYRSAFIFCYGFLDGEAGSYHIHVGFWYSVEYWIKFSQFHGHFELTKTHEILSIKSMFISTNVTESSSQWGRRERVQFSRAGYHT